MPWMTPQEARNMLTLVNTITPGGEPSSTFKIKDWAEILPILTDEGLLKTASYGKIKDFIKRTDLLEGNIEYLFKRLIDANPELRERISQFSKFNVGGINTEKCQEWRKETLTKKINKDENGDGEKNWKDLPADKILYELAENIDNNKFFPQFVQELVKCAKGDPSHKDVELWASERIAEIIGAEFVFYNERPDGKMVTGHPDLIIVKDGAIFICDYKPKDELEASSGRMREHFWHEIPQIAGYAITLKEQLGFPKSSLPKLSKTALIFTINQLI
jgi:ATP-dependent exoDNAse (exonuclease V) beta subunit